MTREQIASQELAAKRLEVHQTMVSQLLRGAGTPGLKVALKIREVTGIPLEAWLA